MLDDNRWISMTLEHIDEIRCSKLCRFPSPELTRQNRKNDEYRTFRVNQFFSYIPTIVKDLEHKKTGKFQDKLKNSGSVPEAGVEPARPQWSQDFKSCVSTSSTTRATLKLVNTLKKTSR